MVVFVTTCKNRTHYLKSTLPKNMADNPRSKFLVLNYGTQDDLMEYLKLTFPSEIAEGRLVVYTYSDWPRYRFSHAKNLAHRLAILEGADFIVSVDADNYTGKCFEDFIEESISNNTNGYLWAKMIKGEMTRGVNGRIGVRSEHFMRVGGYCEEKFADWGSEDKDFNKRLEMSGYTPIEIPKEFLIAIAHGDKVRFEEFPDMLKGKYIEVDPSTIKKRVANGGRFGCGIVYRNFDETDISILNPVPTRIFGIGMQKTGTNSLHKAFQRLGLKSLHWGTASLAKQIWQEMNTEGRSITLEQYDSASDLPIPLLFKKLDASYAGSKFILTIRNEARWLDSVRRHFDPEQNRWARTWDEEPFAHRSHELTYGRRDFDTQVFIERYRKHNMEVLNYFRDRPDSLLVMNLDHGDGWEKLCPFLGRPVPSPFPHENRS
jgi:hypothetical protein